MSTSVTDPVQLYYETHAARLDEESRTHQDFMALKEFASRLPRGGRVLDAACGTGWDLAWFKSQGLEAEGVDFSSAMLERARRFEMPVTQRDLRLLSLRRETFDGIWCNRALMHLSIEEAQRVLAGFFQALRPRTGVLFVSFLEGSATEPNREELPDAPGVTLHRYPVDGFFSLLRQTGFRVVLSGEKEEAGAKWRAVLAQRL